MPKVVLDCALGVSKDGGFTASPWNSLAISIQFITACLPALKCSFSYTAKWWFFKNLFIKILQTTIVSSSTAHGWFVKSQRPTFARHWVVVFLLQSRPPGCLLANFSRAQLQHKNVCEEAKEQYCETLACILFWEFLPENSDSKYVTRDQVNAAEWVHLLWNLRGNMQMVLHLYDASLACR